MAAACRRVGQLGSGIALARSGGFGAISRQCRHVYQLQKSEGKRLFLVDTLALVRKLEEQGVPSKQAEAITAASTEILENVSQSYVSNVEMQKTEMIQEANLSKFKFEVQSSQDRHYSFLQQEIEKVKNDVEKMRSELRHEMNKETHALRVQLEEAKYDMIKYLGTFVSVCAASLAAFRIFYTN